MRRTPYKKAAAIGRTRTVIVFDRAGKPVGVVSEVMARLCPDAAERLVFRGPVRFSDRTLAHLHSTVLPVVDAVTGALKGAPGKYEVSITNLGASSSMDTGLDISGFSADLPIFLALVSASLQVGLEQDIVGTGHVASMEGHLSAVRDIPAKLEAAVASAELTAFVFPELEKDGSLERLKPSEYEAATDSVFRNKGKIRVFPVRGVHDAARIFMTDESIVLGSLKAGFFDAQPSTDSSNPVAATLTLLGRGNEERFWKVLDGRLLEGDLERARALLSAYAGFHTQRQRYPKDLGGKLLRLAISLPLSVRRLEGLFPLLPTQSCIELSRYAGPADHEDVPVLYRACLGEGLRGPQQPARGPGKEPARDWGEEQGVLEKILFELGEENLREKVGKHLDDARSSYSMFRVTVKDGFEFQDAVSAFYAHLMRCSGTIAANPDPSALAGDATDCVTKAFRGKGGYEEALSEGIHGIRRRDACCLRRHDRTVEAGEKGQVRPWRLQERHRRKRLGRPGKAHGGFHAARGAAASGRYPGPSRQRARPPLGDGDPRLRANERQAFRGLQKVLTRRNCHGSHRRSY